MELYSRFKSQEEDLLVMRTIIIFESCDECVRAFVVRGNHENLHDVYIGTCENDQKERELEDLLYDPQTKSLALKPTPINKLNILLRKYINKGIDFRFIQAGEV